jgi:DUF4097 and DUF4098 domain-containing protein YvlB
MGKMVRRSGRDRRWLAVGLLMAIVIAAGLLVTAGCDELIDDCDDAEIETRDDSFSVGESVKLVVRTSNGAVDVRAGSDGEVQVEATLREPEKIDYDVTQDGDTITVEARSESGRWRGCMMASFVVTVPANTEVDLDTSNGAVALTGLVGGGRFETSNGAIRLVDVTGEYRGDTSNGSIDIDGMEGTADIETSNGAVNVVDFKGEVELRSSNGRMSFSGELTAGGDNRLETSNGRVTVELLGEPSVRIDAENSNGDISTDLPLTLESTSKNHIVGTIGGGEADLYIRTSNGDVDIR